MKPDKAKLMERLATVFRKPRAAPLLDPEEAIACGLNYAMTFKFWEREISPDTMVVKAVTMSLDLEGYAIKPKERADFDVDGATPVAEWPREIDERVLIYVVHQNAKYERDEATRLREWEGWHVGYWTDHNNGGWVWHGLLGEITHVAPLPLIPKVRRA